MDAANAAVTVSSMTDSEVRQLALDIVQGRVFTSLHILSEDFAGVASMVFLPIALGGQEIIDEFKRNDVAMVWEYIDKAGPRSINGYPIFFSFRCVTRADAARVRAKHEEFAAVMDAVK
jgi:hypothetical protein